jgi:hypothetical protein
MYAMFVIMCSLIAMAFVIRFRFKNHFEEFINAFKVIVLPRPLPPVDEYEEYETPRLIALIWFDNDLIAECGHCGMDDAPVLESWNGSKLCKWCRELAALTYHLQHHGSRRRTSV